MKKLLYSSITILFLTGSVFAKPLIHLDFNDVDNGTTKNAGSLGGKAELIFMGDSSMEPLEADGLTGDEADKSILFPNQQINTENQYIKYSRIEIDTKGKLDKMRKFTVAYWSTFPVATDDNHEHIVFSTQPLDNKTGIRISQLPVDGVGQVRVSINDQTWYSGPLAEYELSDEFSFVAVVFDSGSLSLYLGDETEPITLVRSSSIDARNTGEGESLALIGSHLTPFANSWDLGGRIDNFMVFNRALDYDDLDKLREKAVKK